jgi:hypothetical protein
MEERTRRLQEDIDKDKERKALLEVEPEVTWRPLGGTSSGKTTKAIEFTEKKYQEAKKGIKERTLDSKVTELYDQIAKHAPSDRLLQFGQVAVRAAAKDYLVNGEAGLTDDNRSILEATGYLKP